MPDWKENHKEGIFQIWCGITDAKLEDYLIPNTQIISFFSPVLPINSSKLHQFTVILNGLSNNTIYILGVLQRALSGKFCSELKNYWRMKQLLNSCGNCFSRSNENRSNCGDQPTRTRLSVSSHVIFVSLAIQQRPTNNILVFTIFDSHFRRHFKSYG